jgi:hypothetical protein
MGGAYSLYAKPHPGLARRTMPSCQHKRLWDDWDYGDYETHETHETIETSEGTKRLPLYDFRFLRTFLGELDSRYQSFIHVATCLHEYMFFFRDRPPEELDNKRSSTRRGEFDSSTPEAIGVLLG